MKCEQISELLSAYIDQMTSVKENNAIIAHLKSCPDCRRELEELQSMTAMMHDLYTPQLPETFAQELRQHLNDEKITILKPHELKTPSKAGWIAASVAIVALGAGIATSHFVPIDNIVALQEQPTVKETTKPSMSVEDILNRIKIWDKEKPGNTSEGAADVADNNQDPAGPDPETIEQPPETKATPEVTIEEPDSGVRIADIYSARIKVENTEEAINQVIKIADANNAQYQVVGTDSMVQAFSAGSSQMVELKVSPERVDSLIKEFESMGMIAAPMHDETVLSEEYAEALEQIKSINQQIEAAKNNEDQLQLKKLNKDLYDWTSRKTVIDDEVTMDTVRVYLVEEINP